MVRSPQATQLGFHLAWLFIVLVSVVDGYLVWMYRDVIGWTERNPVGVALLSMADGHVWLLLSVKLAGTVLAASWLMVLYHRHPQRGWLIVFGVFLFQLGLLLYLNQGDQTTAPRSCCQFHASPRLCGSACDNQLLNLGKESARSTYTAYGTIRTSGVTIL
ncbi:MAG: hypothetical protein AB7F89_12775 [Pirellulaceae bacterium]